jgi:hypothetical protein
VGELEYLSESQFRWNSRESQDIFALVVAALVIGFALPCAALIEPSEGERGEQTDTQPAEGRFKIFIHNALSVECFTGPVHNLTKQRTNAPILNRLEVLS